ncbi:MAG: AraC family transcriptional regulator ligand-binding domain-containing protein [Endozoicomonas sp.]|uniref:AraC family transcriptional regulator ligand-binding domain-containing protein n=1 Tax=Endozoicomonas sp. TaxID=1892382 RepID=UPI003D9B0BFB
MVFEDQALFPGNELYRIHQLLLEEEISLSMLLLGTGLPESCLTDPEVLLSWRQFDIIYRNAFRLSQRKDVGLLIGNCMDLTRWGVLGSAMSSCLDINHALGLANHYRDFVRSPFDFTITPVHEAFWLV